jgi:hypothetical protein
MHKRRRKEDDEQETRRRQQNQINFFRPTDRPRLPRPFSLPPDSSTALNPLLWIPKKTDQYKNLKGKKRKVKYLATISSSLWLQQLRPRSLSLSQTLVAHHALSLSLSRQLPLRAQRRHKALTDRRSQRVNGGKYRWIFWILVGKWDFQRTFLDRPGREKARSSGLAVYVSDR